MYIDNVQFHYFHTPRYYNTTTIQRESAPGTTVLCGKGGDLGSPEALSTASRCERHIRQRDPHHQAQCGPEHTADDVAGGCLGLHHHMKPPDGSHVGQGRVYGVGERHVLLYVSLPELLIPAPYAFPSAK
jgi:hypothetical protein